MKTAGKAKAGLARCALTAGLALSMALGGITPALADTSSGQTNLYVEVQESHLTSPEGYGEQMKVTIPVAINYVADEQGNLTGPADGATLITNNTRSGAVHVARIGVTPATGITLVESAAEADQDDEAYLSVTPGTGTADSFGNYVVEAAPSAAGDWDVAQGASLALNGLGGKIGGVGGAIDPANKTQIATVNWTVAAGTATQAAERANRFVIHQVTPGGTTDLVTTKTGSTATLMSGYTWHLTSMSGTTVTSVADAVTAANGASEITIYGVAV